jgi:hypothetical protein
VSNTAPTPNPLPVTSPPDVQNNSGSRTLLDLGSVGILPLSNGISAPGMTPMPLSTGSGPTGLPANQNLGSLVSDNVAPMAGSAAGDPTVLAPRLQAPGNTA